MLRLALIGGCALKAGRYAEATARLRGIKFTALAQPDPIKRREAAHTLDVSAAVASLPELLQSGSAEFDAVVIHGSVAQRAELCCRAAEAGKHIFVAAPPATSGDEVDRIASAVNAKGVTFFIGSHVRYRPSIAAMKAALDSGKLGVPALLRVHGWEPKATGEPRQWDQIRHRLYGEMRSRIFQQLDLAQSIFPNAPTEVFAAGRVPDADDLWPDYLQIHLGFPEGGMAVISISRSLPAGDDYQNVSLIGSTGAAYNDDHHQSQLLFRGDHPAGLKSDEIIPTIAAQLQDFQLAIETKRDPVTILDDARSALQLTEAVWTSLHEGRPVRLKGEDDGQP